MRKGALSIITVPLAAVLLVLAAVGAPASASETWPGMCNGTRDENVVLTAHANGAPSEVPKFIVNVSTDGSGIPFGTMVLGKGKDRIEVTSWCRLWHHIPGTVGHGEDSVGHGEDAVDETEGATIVHVVGVTRLRDGTQVMVRVDMRGTEEGDFFRARYRPWPADHDHSVAPVEASAAAMEEEDEGWVWFPVEGWYPLDQFRVRGESVTG